MSKASFNIEFGKLYPYDEPESWDRSAQGVYKRDGDDWTHHAARGIIASLEDRRGVGQELAEIDADIRSEIIDSIAEIIMVAYKVVENEMADALEVAGDVVQTVYC